MRHEQGAGHAAEGYAAASNKIGVAIATSGPGATNLVTAIADAYMDSVPIVCITGQVFSNLMGTDAFQEADIVGITMPITKHSFLVKRAEDIPGAIAAAFEIAGTGRPGPVLVDITKDAQQAEAPFVWPPKIDLPGYRPVTKAHGKQIQAAAQLLAEAKKPVLYVGGGVIRSQASAELLDARRDDRRAGRDDAHGARRVPRLAHAAPRHARHARHGSRRARAAGGRPARLARRAVRRPRDRQGGAVRAATPRSCTSTSTRPRSARSAPPTCRSWAT